jgi:hypothetical protein
MPCPNGHQAFDLLLMAPVKEVVVELKKCQIKPMSLVTIFK